MMTDVTIFAVMPTAAGTLRGVRRTRKAGMAGVLSGLILALPLSVQAAPGVGSVNGLLMQ